MTSNFPGSSRIRRKIDQALFGPRAHDYASVFAIAVIALVSWAGYVGWL
jgi:hypothetical protein